MDISISTLTDMEISLTKDPSYGKIRNIMDNVFIKDACTDNNELNKHQYKFNHKIDVADFSTDQHNSGRCWLFAALNVVRHKLVKHYKLDKSFELSQAYLFKYHKLESCNNALELGYYLIKSEGPAYINSLHYNSLFGFVTGDGGCWNTFADLVNKYGILPKECYPDYNNVKNTRYINNILTSIIKNAMLQLSKANYKDRDQFDIFKHDVLSQCSEVIFKCFGKNPDTITWKGKTYESPISFYDNVVKPIIDINDFVCISNVPNLEYNTTLKCKQSPIIIPENINEYEKTTSSLPSYINLDLKRFKKCIKKCIDKHNTCVFFGSNWNTMYKFDCVLDDASLDLDLIIGTKFKQISKKDRLDAFDISQNHAMIISGYNEDNCKINRWKVENSHGRKKSKHNGLLIMSDNWFNNNVLSAVVHKKCLPKNLVIDGVKYLEHWYPLGSLML